MRHWLALYKVPVLLAAVALAIAGLAETGSSALGYDRQAILGGAVWRLLTGHWVHLSLTHLCLNLLGLAFVWGLFGQAMNTRQWLAVMLVIALGQSLSLLVLHPDIDWFVGLSGLLHGAMVAGALLSLRGWPALAGAALVLVTLKVATETFQGGSEDLASWIAGPVLVETHLYGALWGLGSAIGVVLSGRSSGKRCQ